MKGGTEVSGFMGGTDGGAPIEKGLYCCNDGVDVDGGAEVGGGGSSGFNDAAGGPPAIGGGGGKAALLEPDIEELLALLRRGSAKNDQN